MLLLLFFITRHSSECDGCRRMQEETLVSEERLLIYSVTFYLYENAIHRSSGSELK
jgi:hypothetical protein